MNGLEALERRDCNGGGKRAMRVLSSLVRGGLLAACSLSMAGHAWSFIGTAPDCPSVADAIVIVASGPTVASEPLSVTVSGSTIKLVALEFDSGFTLPPATRVRATLPPLAEGRYEIAFHTRRQPDGSLSRDPATLLPEVFRESRSLEVYVAPPPCRAATVEVVGSPFVSAPVANAYPEPLRFLVKDAHGYPVANQTLYPRRVKPPHEPSTNAPVADLAETIDSVTTGPDGIATLVAAANGVEGAFQYRAEVSTVDTTSTAHVVFYNRPVESVDPNYPVVEFERYVPERASWHYFMTGNPVEMAKLDRSRDWRRTGAVFMSFAPGTGRPEARGVCRFYGLPAANLDSHFFSADPDECAAVREKFVGSWEEETANAFEVMLPDRQTGDCPAGSVPLHRAFNNRPDANHRYALSTAVLIRDGSWTLEGYGPGATVMCLPR